MPLRRKDAAPRASPDPALVEWVPIWNSLNEGPQGPQGPPGPPGADGADGAPGPVGPEGPQGPQGPEGPGTNIPDLAPGTVLGRGSESGVGDPEELTLGTGLQIVDKVISATADAGMDLDYLGPHVPGPTYNDGDIVIGPDGIAYMCVKDGTTTPPEPWPGVGIATAVGPPGPQGPQGPAGPEGPEGPEGPQGPPGPDSQGVVDATYWTSTPHSSLVNERAMNALADGYVKTTAGQPHTLAVIPLAEGGTGATTAAQARTNLGLGTMAVQNANAVAVTGGTVGGSTTINTSGVIVTTANAQVGSMDVRSMAPQEFFTDLAAPVNQKVFRVAGFSGNLNVQAFSDDLATVQTTYVFGRSGDFIAPRLHGDGANLTALNGSQVTTGTVADVRLSSNVALKNIDNQFVAQNFAAWSSFRGANGALSLYDTNGGVNQKSWRFLQYGDGTLHLEGMTDDQSATQGRISFDRSGQIWASGAALTNLNASQLTHGTVPTARLGTGTASASTFLRGDQTWQPLPAAFPSGLIVLSLTPCPVGWTRIVWDGLYLRVGPTPGASGGAYDHVHEAGSFASQDHTHGPGTYRANDHNHGGTVGVSISGNTDSQGSHSHSVTVSGTTVSQGANTGPQTADAGGSFQTIGPHTHNIVMDSFGSTSNEGAHSHGFSGSGNGGIPGDSPPINGASAAAGALPVVGTSAAATVVMPFVDVFVCQKN